MSSELEDGLALTFEEIGRNIKTLQESSGGANEGLISDIAGGFTLALQEELKALDGQVGKTVLAVAYSHHQSDAPFTPNHKAQVTSLGSGNVMFHYASGSDFLNNVIAEGPVFLDDGEIYVFQNVGPGSILTTTEGAYGYSQQRNNNDESPMPLLSIALAFTDTFLFAFRNSNVNEGIIRIVNGPITSVVTLTNASGSVVQGQENITFAPWEYKLFTTAGNGEYRLTSNNILMSAVHAEMDTKRFYDSRLVLPVSSKICTWPRSGFLSALYSGTIVDYWVNDGVTGKLNAGLGIGPGSPEDIDAATPQGTGAGDSDYEKRGFTLFEAAGLVSAYSGADSAGLEASPACPISLFSQKIALPLYIRNAGDGGNNGIAIGSLHEGVANLYEWDAATRTLNLVTVNDPSGNPTTDIILNRHNVVVDSPGKQKFPCAASITAQGGPSGNDANGHDLLGDFKGGFLVCNVPCMVVFNSEQNENGSQNRFYRGTSSTDPTDISVLGIHSDDDEQLSFGIIPDDIRAEITRGDDGYLYKRKISNSIQTWDRT